MLQGLCRLEGACSERGRKISLFHGPDLEPGSFSAALRGFPARGEDRIPSRGQRARTGGGGAGRHFRAPRRLRTVRRMVAGNGRSRARRRHPAVSRPGYRLSGRPRRELNPERRRPFPAHQFLRSGGSFEPDRAAPRPEVAARHRRRLVRRHGRAVFCRTLPGAHRAHRGLERGRQGPGAVHRMAQRAAANRARGDRARRRRRRA